MGRFPAPTLPSVSWQWEEFAQDALSSNVAPIKPWEQFMREDFDIRAGEHVTVIGTTGSGKTNLLIRVATKMPFVCVLGAKKVDDTMDFFIDGLGYMRMPKWRQIQARDVPHRVIWPHPGKISEMVKLQRDVFTDTFEHVWAEGGRPKTNPVGWTVVVDEMSWFTEALKLDMYLKIILKQGRSSGISLFGATQRPAWIPQDAYSQATHLFFYRETDLNNLARIAEMDYGSKDFIRMLLPTLPKHQCLYVNTRTGLMARTSAPPVALAA